MFGYFHFPFFAQICIIVSSASNQYERGWVPISRDEVYQRMRINVRSPANVQQVDRSWISEIELTTENIFKSSPIEQVTPQQVLSGFTRTANQIDVPFKNKEDEPLATAVDNTTGSSKCVEIITIEGRNDGNSKHINIVSDETATSGSQRKPKMIYAPIELNSIQENFIHTHDKTGSLNEESNVRKSYEVSEDEDELHRERTKLQTSGYSYEPRHSNASNNNFSNILFDILGRYKIRDNFNTVNYDKSRVFQERQKPRPHFVLIPLPVSDVSDVKRYNSPNHLPVDPLLAVFLSNYGHYLPNLYRFNNHYRNLYGYLASNNYHNNQPFASYKIFSDTDSSN